MMVVGRGMRRRSFASEGRFGEAEPVGCASIREHVDTCRTCRLGGESIVSRKVREVREGLRPGRF